MNELENIKNKLLFNAPNKIKEYIELINIDKKRPLGKMNISSWAIEVTRGCNLQCGCCATRLFPKNEYKHLTIDTWKKIIKIISIISPYSRIDLDSAGEPTLNPNLNNILQIGRKISPHSFFEIITNGTTLIQNKITYKELFNSGANLIYTDMYAPKEKHIELARKSGYPFYVRGTEEAKKFPAAWTYHNDMNIKIIVLQENPKNWSKRTVSSGRFSTFMNNLDWEAAKLYGLYPVKKAVNRRCNQPFRMATISYDGLYSFCCYDFVRNVFGKIGNVDTGIEGFINYWLGEYMMRTRKLVHNKDRNGHELCRYCNFTQSRGDIPCWKDDIMDYYWENNKWNKNKVKINKTSNSLFN